MGAALSLGARNLGQVWPNPAGTAPGLLIVHQDKPVILLPGVPQEMEALAARYVVPYLRERTGRTVETFTLRTSGVDLRVTAAGSDGEQVRAVAARARRELLERVGAVLMLRPTPIRPRRDLIEHLRRSPRWQLVWADDRALLFVKGPPPASG